MNDRANSVARDGRPAETVQFVDGDLGRLCAVLGALLIGIAVVWVVVAAVAAQW